MSHPRTLPAIPALAAAFSRLLHEELGARTMAEVVTRNAHEPDPTICHSHDFTDANQLMATAWEELAGYTPDGNDEAQAAVWRAAWHAARAAGFTIS